jgi:YVTN family beta-propeller protein
MRSLRTLVCIFAALSVVVSIAEAKTDYAYVANIGANTVSVINTTTNAIVATIPVGDGPWGVAVNQAGTYAYVVNNHDTASGDSVSVISTATNAVVATIKVGSLPFGIAFSPSGTTAYVANGNSNTVSVINTGTKAVTATVPVQNYPVGLAVMGNGAFVYVANDKSGSVSVISTVTKKVVATITVGSNPIAVAISPDSATAFVTNSGSNTISVIQTATNKVINTINVSAGPFGAAVSPDGHWLYVANSNGNNGDLVTVIDTASQTIKTTVVVGKGPAWVSFSEDSAFAYVTGITSDNVTVINTASATVAHTITVGAAPIGIGVMGTVKVSTVVGGYVGDKGPATSAAIEGPSSSVIDSAGNVYVSDVFGNRIRKITPTGTITTYAGNGMCGYNGVNIPASTAMVCPQGLAFDGSGNLIEADSYGRIRRISKTGIVTTIAGNGTFGPGSGDGGPATSADIGQPFYLNYDSSGNLYFASIGECRVRKVDTSGIITTAAGTGTCGYNGDGIKATAAQLNYPHGVALDTAGNLYISDTQNHRVRKVNSSGIISTFAGTGKPGFSGDGGLATKANIGGPRAVTVHNGSLYITNAGDTRVRYVNLSTHIINTYAGSIFGYDGDGHSLLATLFSTGGPVLFDSSGNPYFNDTNNGRLRKATGGVVNTFAGGYLGDGAKATSAALVLPEALAIDKSGNFYIADWSGHRIRKVSGGTVSTLTGTGVSGYTGDNGPGTMATLYGPQGVTVDSNGNVFIADTNNRVIRKVDTGGMISTFATSSNFSYLLQMATDSANNLYVADNGACVVWKITSAAVVSIVAGVLNTCGYNGDGIAATTAQLSGPYSVAMDLAGDLFIADNFNNRIREVNTSGTISTITGDGNCTENGDGGTATSAEICSPYGVAVHSGTVYTTDGLGRIRQISGGTITSYAGTGSFGFNGDGLWPLLTVFDEPVAVALDSKGTVYVLDDWDHRVRKIQ